MKCVKTVIIIIMLVYGCTEKESPIGENGAEKESKTSGVIPIVNILKDVERYRGRIVVIRGSVKPGLAFEFVNEQPYQLKDNTGEIWVVTTSIMPEKNRVITVVGEVAAPYQIKGRRYDIVIIERQRK